MNAMNIGSGCVACPGCGRTIPIDVVWADGNFIIDIDALRTHIRTSHMASLMST